ncbi:MAG: hypothetical protein WCQ16_08185 [Verrucomicrobiae bacterium]
MNATSLHDRTTSLLSLRIVLHLLCILRKPWRFAAARFHAQGILREL